MKKYINKYALLIFGLLTILTFNAAIFGQKCDADAAQNNADINGKVWQLTAIDGNAVNTDQATIRFDFEKNQVGGKGGCNGFGGTLTVNGDKIKISEIISTKMFCENGSDVENKYLPKLEQVTKYKIVDGKLQLLNNEAVVLEFAAKN